MTVRACARPGCAELVRGANLCPAHQRAEAARYERRRGTSTQRGYNTAWRRYRERFLTRNPWCVSCGKLATVVDHIVDHKGDRALFWDEGNHQAMCAGCHSVKTNRTGRGHWRATGGRHG